MGRAVTREKDLLANSVSYPLCLEDDSFGEQVSVGLTWTP